MGILKFICKKFACKSSCMYNGNNELFDRSILSMPLENYELKIKDLKKIIKILNKKKIIKLGKLKRTFSI